MEEKGLAEKARLLISAFEKGDKDFSIDNKQDKKITVNRVVSEVATWYERIRNAMDYRANEVILRAAIERILKRRILILGGDGKSIAEPLVRELIWARYFPNESVPEAIIEKLASSIDLFRTLRQKILEKHQVKENIIDEWIYHLLSSDIEQILNPNRQDDVMRNFIFASLKDSVTIADDKRETADAQVFIAVCKSFAKDDTAFLRYHLFKQFFGTFTRDNLERVAVGFADYYKETQHQLNYKLKDKILSYVKNQTPPFAILTDILKRYKINADKLTNGREELKKVIFEACGRQYNSIGAKIQRAIIRSVIFILLTKAIFALSIEGTYETLCCGQIDWTAMSINIGIPPLLMVILGLFIRTPGRENSSRIFHRIESILFEENSKTPAPLELKLKPDKTKPLLNAVFTLLWLSAFVVSFSLMYIILSKINFNIVNKAVFIFFFSIVSFLSYRISQMAHEYTYEERAGLLAPLVDFFFMPIIRVGRNLTEGIAQLNLLIFILDFIIETPFKGLFAFFEQWFLFLHTKREELG